MAPEELDSQIRTFIEICEDCADTPIDNLVSNPRWGELNFEGARDDIEKAFSTLNNFLKLPIDKLPIDEIQPMIQSLRSFQNTINEIKSFDIASNDPFSESDEGYFSEYDIQKRDIIVKNLKRKVDNFYENAQPWIPYLTHHKNNIQRNIEKLATASVDAEQSPRIFFDEAKTLKESAIRWLRVAGLLCVLTLAVAFAFLSLGLDAKDGYTAVQLITAKLIVLSVLLSTTVWCAKIYKVNMHQVATNRHRANSIEASQIFTEAASNDVTRDAVLTEVTRAICEPSATGYLGKKAASSGSDHIEGH